MKKISYRLGMFVVLYGILGIFFPQILKSITPATITVFIGFVVLLISSILENQDIILNNQLAIMEKLKEKEE